MNEFGRKIKELRNRRDLTVRELAGMLDKSPAYISKIEVRGEIPSPEFICNLADALSVSPRALLDLAKTTTLNQAEHKLSTKFTEALTLFRKAK